MNPTLTPLASRPSSAIPAGAPRRWRPTPALAAIIAAHAGAAGFAAVRPASWPYALGAIVGSHAIMVAAGLWPRSALLGPNWTRLPDHVGAQIAITIDDGPDPEVTPYVLDLLDRYDARATFFCIGERALRYPHLVEAIVARGHSVENHSQRHRHYFSLMGPLAMRREIGAAQRTLTELTGTTPLFFRAPAGLRNPFLEPALCAHGLQLASWTRRGFDTRASDAGLVADRLLRGLAARDIVLLHDGNAARDAQGRPVILDALETVLRGARDAGLSCITLRAALTSARAFSSAEQTPETTAVSGTR